MGEEMPIIDACIRCKRGLRFIDEHRTYWCRARKDKISLKGCQCLWDKICRYFVEKDERRKESGALYH
jgi:hypothetical protein